MNFLINNQRYFSTQKSAVILTLLSVTCFTHAFEPYHAEYQFNIDKYLTSNASRDLIKEAGDDNWQYVFKTSVLKVGKAIESAKFSIDTNQVRPIEHSMDVKVPFKHKTSTIKFNSSNNKANVNKNGSNKSYALQKDFEDELTIELQIRMDLKNGKLKPYYNIADENGIQKVVFVNDGEETVNTPAGNYQTVKIHRIHDLDTLTTIFWLAPELDYLPVKMMHHDVRHYNMKYSMSLVKYTAQK